MNTPKIRFKEFKDDWEQRKLGELAEIVGGGTPSTSVNSYWDGDIDWYAPAEIGEQIYLESSQRKITEEGLNKSSAKILPIGTVLFTSRAGIGKTAILLKEGCTNQGFQSIVPNKEKLDSYFIFTRSEELKRYGETVGAGSTFVEVSGKQMANMELMMPKTMPEQQQIGEYFANLDNLITLHQRKCDETKQLKKFMLQKMFPKNGEKNPEIRFKGFTDDWEQRKVGDQMYIKSRIGWQALTKQEYLSEGDYYLITGTDIDETTHRVDLKRSYYVSKERYEMDSKIQVKEGDIIVTKDGTIGKVAMVTGLDKPATLNSHLFVLRDMSGKLDNHFLLHILNSHMFNHFVKSTKTGSTLTGLPQKTFVEFAFSCPKYEEQKLLSNYFDRLDHLITLHQRKCEKLKELKKFMLQNMFV